MRWVLGLVLAVGLSGCKSVPMIKKAYDEGYAKGYGNGRVDEKMSMGADPEIANLSIALGDCRAANEQIRQRLDACLNANVEK